MRQIQHNNFFRVMVLGGAFAVFAHGCSKTFTPTTRRIKAHQPVQPFIIKPKQIVGVFVNLDVDALLFRYSTSITDPDIFWRDLDAVLKDSLWKLSMASDSERRFERIRLPGNKARFTSLEQVRIAYDDSTSTVIVAYVQLDSSNRVDSFADAESARWAKYNVWPLFYAEIKDTSAASR